MSKKPLLHEVLISVVHKIVSFNQQGQQVFQKVLPEVLPPVHPDTSLHLGVELLVVAGGIVGPFVGGPEDEKVGSTWIDRDSHLISP